jgi:hypothetical protein
MVLEILRSREDSPARESAPDALREEGEVALLAANRAGTTVRAIDAYPSYFTIDLQRNSAVSGVCVRSIGQYFQAKAGARWRHEAPTSLLRWVPQLARG